LELINPNLDNSLVENWAASVEYGTPGRQNSQYDIKTEGGEGTSFQTLKKDIINYPNPFNDQTTIRFKVRRAHHVKIQIYNLLGQLVRTLVDAPRDAGEHEVVWDGRNSDRMQIASGIYFYVFIFNYEIQSIEKMVKL
jgi:flagellar hook assembly protein FlgD